MPDFIAIEEINEQLQLKPSFKLKCSETDLEKNLQSTKNLKYYKDVVLKQMDEHLWFAIPKSERTYYSPRLHVEIEKKEGHLILHCTFGPEPNFWTLFIFIHFFLALAFLSLIIWGYTNMIMQGSNVLVYVLCSTIIAAWIMLYVLARRNRKKASPQSQRLLKALKHLVS
jgi:hypothetical protein